MPPHVTRSAAGVRRYQSANSIAERRSGASTVSHSRGHADDPGTSPASSVLCRRGSCAASRLSSSALFAPPAQVQARARRPATANGARLDAAHVQERPNRASANRRFWADQSGSSMGSVPLKPCFAILGGRASRRAGFTCGSAGASPSRNHARLVSGVRVNSFSARCLQPPAAPWRRGGRAAWAATGSFGNSGAAFHKFRRRRPIDRVVRKLFPPRVARTPASVGRCTGCRP